ncbi:hypothetical protein [Salmonella phage SD-2_S15]|nr:hypothetical protein [Salmonella phage SD-2_S15]
MKLNPHSKQYLKHFKYLNSIQAESVTSAYTYHPNVLKKRNKKEKSSTNGVNVSKNLELYMKKNNIAVHYMNIYNTDLKVLSTNTSTKVLKNASFMYSTVIDNPALYKNAYNLTKHVQEIISTNKKMHHLITYITNYV